MVNTQEYLTRLQQSLGARYSENTVRAFLGHAHSFLSVAGNKPAYGKQEVLRFVDKLVVAGYKETSIVAIVSGVRALFVANGWPWPIEKRDLHLGLPQEDANAPIMPVEDIVRLVAYGRQCAFPVAPALALATIWGLRAQEISEVLSAGCDGVTLEIQTAKAGRKRVHCVPKAVAPYLIFRGRTIGVDGMHKMFDRIIATLAGRHAVNREGWHAIRRAVITGLIENGVSEIDVHKFFGWRVKKEITFKYYRPEQASLDETIYAKHPFLALWGTH